MLPAYLFVLIVQLSVKATFNKYSKIKNSRGLTGASAATEILRRGGAFDVKVVPVQGSLTDNYNPTNKALSLSQTVYSVASIASVGVAAHEAGHALQHNEDYFPVKLRSAMVPVCNIGSRFALPLIIIGMIMSVDALVFAGIIAFSLVVLFQLATLPVEFNASRRAIKILDETDMLSDEELKGAKKVLTAAALTYVGALAVSVFQLMYYVSMTNSRRR